MSDDARDDASAGLFTELNWGDFYGPNAIPKLSVDSDCSQSTSTTKSLVNDIAMPASRYLVPDAMSGPKASPNPPLNGPPHSDAVESKHVAWLNNSLLQALMRVSEETDTVSAEETIISETCDLLQCDRADLLLVDDASREFVLKVAKGAEAIRVPMGVGILGAAYFAGGIINVPNAYQDPRFLPTQDTETGYSTRATLCCAVTEKSGKLIAILQALNKKSGAPFSTVDESLIKVMSRQAAITLRIARESDALHRSEMHSRNLLRVIKTLHDVTGISNITHELASQLPDLLMSDRAAIFIYDKTKKDLFCITDPTFRFKPTQGLAGACFNQLKTLNIADAYSDERFIRDYDISSG